MLDRLTGMKVYARVAALGGLSVAARSLGLSPTLVTKHVAALEDRLGVKLLHRTTRRLTLTEAGRRYLEGVERVLADVEEIERGTIAERHDVRGTLRVNAPLSFGFRVIAPLMAEFGARYPALTVDLGLNDRIVDLVDEGWDVAVRIGQMRDGTVVARRLAPCRMMVCAAPAWLARHGTPVMVADLSRHNCLIYTLSGRPGPDQWSFGTNGEIRVPVTGTLRASNGDALVAAAVAGQGIVCQPTFLLRDALLDGTLVPLRLDHPTVDMPGIFAVYPAHPHRWLPAKVRAFNAFLAEKFSPTTSWDEALMKAGIG